MFVKNGNNRQQGDLHLELIGYEANRFILTVEKKLNKTWILMRKQNNTIQVLLPVLPL